MVRARKVSGQELAAEMVLVSSYVKWANGPHPHMHLEVQVRWWGQRPSTWQTWATLGVPFHTTELFMAILIFQFLGQMLRNKRQLRKAPNFKELPMHRGARKVGVLPSSEGAHVGKVLKRGNTMLVYQRCWCTSATPVDLTVFPGFSFRNRKRVAWLKGGQKVPFPEP